MKEIELKAHVADRESLIRTLDRIARFAGSVSRDDTYWAPPKRTAQEKMPSIRIRKESSADGTVRTAVTYKRKELKVGTGGISTEVNEELETLIENGQPLEAFFADCLFTIRLTKHKDVMAWTLALEDGHTVTLELCSVPPLGDFLEIEILTQSEDAGEQALCQRQLLDVLALTGIDSSCIEPRYYSELLKNT